MSDDPDLHWPPGIEPEKFRAAMMSPAHGVVYWDARGVRLGWWFAYTPEGSISRKIIPIMGPSICITSGGGMAVACAEVLEMWQGPLIVFPPPFHAPYEAGKLRAIPCPVCPRTHFIVTPRVPENAEASA